MKPAVSIIMPTYNRGYIIRTAIDSVRAQTNPRWELIIVDDGSTDDTAQVVAAYRDSRIRYFPQRSNAGPSVARNLALSVAQADWICYLDSDNELLPSYIEVMLEHFKRRPQAKFGLPKGDYVQELYQDGHLVASIDKSAMFPATLTLRDVFHFTIPFDMNGFMHARTLTDEGIRFDEDILGLEDWDLILQMGERHPEAFLYVPVTLVKYRQRGGVDARSASGSYSRRAKKLEYIYRKHRHAPLMAGQTWYPAQVEKWNRLEAEFQAGRLPPLYLYEFPQFWPASLRRNRAATSSQS